MSTAKNIAEWTVLAAEAVIYLTGIIGLLSLAFRLFDKIRERSSKGDEWQQR